MTDAVPADTRDTVTVERVIPAPPKAIFDLLADPRRHADIDGSGTVRTPKNTPERLTLGSTFGMNMKLGFPYSMVNTVVELEEDRRIAWQPRAPGIFAKLAGGRIWRYELEPVDGGTRVRETWDISQERFPQMLRNRRMRDATRRNMAATLERIEALTAGPAAS